MEKLIVLPAGELRVCLEGYIHLVWGPESKDSQAAQVVFTHVLGLLQRTGYRKLLTDQRQRAIATEEYMGWLLAIWLTQAGGGPLLTHVAVVTARSLEVRLQAVDVCRQGLYRYGICSRFFDSPAAAEAWLRASA